MTSLSHQAAEVLYHEGKLHGAPIESVALIIAKVTGCDEMADLMRNALAIVKESISEDNIQPMVRGYRRNLHERMSTFLSRLQPTKKE